MKQWLLVWCVLGLGQFSVAQQQASRWYFGSNAGMNFSNGTPAALTDGKLVTVEGCASICDAQGKLLFYTNGVTIWNRQHAIMQNGTGLLGDPSSTQAGIIVPQPGNDSTYYVFTVDNNGQLDGLCYSIVNVLASNGLGAVISKNNRLVTPVTEKLTAVKHANGRDIWVVAHEWRTNVFCSYLVTSKGIDTHQVKSATGTAHDGNSTNAIGYMKASPDGAKLALAIRKKNLYELFDFNNQTGKVSNPVTFASTLFDDAYGVEFSPDGTKLYINSSASATNPKARIYQIDLQQNNQITLVATSASQYAGALQNGPDGKIYFARYDNNTTDGGSYLGVIKQPDVAGAACGYVDNGVYLNGRLCTLGLPSFIQSYFYQPLFTANSVCSGEPMKLSITDSLQIGQATWRFGDSVGDLPQNSSDASITHVFRSPGEYQIDLSVVYKNGPMRTASGKATVMPSPTVNLGNDTTLCSGQLVLNATQPGATYQWQDGSSNSSFTITQSGTYSVEVKSGACTTRDSIQVSYVQPLAFNLGADQKLCAGESLQLRVFSGRSHYWQDGSTDETFEVTAPGVYWTEVTDGCQTVRDSVRISYITLPAVDLGPDAFLPTGELLTLDATQPGATYQWQDGSSNNSFTITQPGIYWVKIQNACGIASDTIAVTQVEITPDPDVLPVPEPAPHPVICTAENFPNVITPNGDGKNDTFQINCPTEQNWQLTIYNRWGKTLFQMDVYRGDWNAEGMGNGIYYYTLINKTGYSVKGVIHVLR